MHDGSMNPGFPVPVRRVDAEAETPALARHARRQIVVASDVDCRPSSKRPLSAKQRLLEQTWADYYSV